MATLGENYYNWSKDNVRNALSKHKGTVTLSMNKNTYENEQDIVRWVNELGHSVQEHQAGERIIVKVRK